MRARTHLMVGVLVVLVLAAISWFVILGHRFAAASDLAAQTEEVEFNNTATQNRYTQTLQQAATATKAASAAQALFATMPQQADLPQVMQQIIAAAGRAGIDGKQISVINSSVPRSLTGDAATGADPESPAGAAAKGLGVDLAQLDLDVTLTSNRANLLRFLDELQGLDRAVLVTQTGITSLDQPGGGPENAPGGGNKGGQSLDVTASMFVLQSRLPDIVAAVGKVISDAGIVSPAFGQTASPAPTGTPVAAEPSPTPTVVDPSAAPVVAQPSPTPTNASLPSNWRREL